MFSKMQAISTSRVAVVWIHAALRLIFLAIMCNAFLRQRTHQHLDSNIATTKKTLWGDNFPSKIINTFHKNRNIGNGKALRIKVLDTPTVPTYQLYNVAGTGLSGGTSGAISVATSTMIDYSDAVFVDTTANFVYFVDTGSRRVRKVTLSSGIMTAVVGSGSQVFGGDGGRATGAGFSWPNGFCMSTSGVMFVSDLTDRRVRTIDTGGIITTYAGKGTLSGTATAVNGDGGAATAATFMTDPHYSICLDLSRNLYLADTNSFKIRKVDATTRVITTIAGTGLSLSEYGKASSSAIGNAFGLFVDSAYKVYMSMNYPPKINLITTDNMLSLFVGDNGGDYADNSALTNTAFGGLHGLWGNTMGDIYFCSPVYSRVRVIRADTGYVQTIAGSGATSASVFSTFGIATTIPMINPISVYGDTVGQVFILSSHSDGLGGNNIRRVFALTESPTVSPTSAPSVVPSRPPTALPTVSPSASPSIVPTLAPSSVPTVSPSRLPTVTPSISPTHLPTCSPSMSPSVAPTTTPTRTPTSTPSVTPSIDPSISPTAAPTATPSTTPTIIPSIVPTLSPSTSPTHTPSEKPSAMPSERPSVPPTTLPTVLPTLLPSLTPSAPPSVTPTTSPTCLPTTLPSMAPSAFPSFAPSVTPSATPTSAPSVIPSLIPSPFPTASPSVSPSNAPTHCPSVIPTLSPSTSPSAAPSHTPTLLPTICPTGVPTSIPTSIPTANPSTLPTVTPSLSPTPAPSTDPSAAPSPQPTQTPSNEPTVVPGSPTGMPVTSAPSVDPTTSPSSTPTTTPSSFPTNFPTNTPTNTPTCVPSFVPSFVPSMEPTATPSAEPTKLPTETPSAVPTVVPTVIPSVVPSAEPTVIPSVMPSAVPTVVPTVVPSVEPTKFPTETPSAEPTAIPTELPTLTPSWMLTTMPSTLPSESPSTVPVPSPSLPPTSLSTAPPSLNPSSIPTIEPTMPPSSAPSESPSRTLTIVSSEIPSMFPTAEPTAVPTLVPSTEPSFLPTILPSSSPTSQPTIQPSSLPSSQPSFQPSAIPSSQPSKQPSSQPSQQPSRYPSAQPSAEPTTEPSGQPTSSPTKLSQVPSPSPTELSEGTFPSNNSISVVVVGDVNSTRNGNTRSFKIVLPFLRVTPTLPSYSGFIDVAIYPVISSSVSYVVYGSNITTSKYELGNLPHTVGFLTSRAVSYDYSGRSVSNAGDINGDGHDDLIIGVPYAARCYVLFGTAQGFLNMTEGFTIFGAQLSDLTGWSVSGAGDVNNDTFADIVIGAPYARNGITNCGAAYVFLGKKSGFQNVRVDALLPEQGFVIFGSSEGDTLGVSVSSAGDVNSDGCDDVIIGALKATSSYRGGAYIVYGVKALRGTLYLSAFMSLEGFSMVGAVWSYSGYSVSGAGDVNGDGFDDVLIGSVPFKTSFGVQTTYVVYGDATRKSSVDLSKLTKLQGVVISGGGVVVSGVGDINHDGYDDILIGSNYGFTGAGFVVFTNITDRFSSVTPLPSPTALPTTLRPTAPPSRKPTADPTASPTRLPTITPSLRPTVLQSGPSEPPTEAPTGPTSRPSSRPSMSTDWPSSQPTTNEPSSQPSTQPSSVPSSLPTETSQQPTLRPTQPPSTQSPTKDTSPNPSFRSRNPVVRGQTHNPTVPISGKPEFFIDVGGSYEKHHNKSVSYVINTSDMVRIAGLGSSEGDIYTVLPQVNGSLSIEIFNNISDKLNLTSHSTIHSMPDLVITSGSVIITFPTSGQRIRLANLTPLDISENNFIFKPVITSQRETVSEPYLVGVVIGSLFGSLFVLFVAYVACNRGAAQAKRIKQYKAGIIALEDNPTRLIIAVNDMYAHFDAYIPNNVRNNNNNNNNSISNNNSHNSNNSHSNNNSSGQVPEEKSSECSPLTSFEQQLVLSGQIVNNHDCSDCSNNTNMSVHCDGHNSDNNAYYLRGAYNNGSDASSFVSMFSDSQEGSADINNNHNMSLLPLQALFDSFGCDFPYHDSHITDDGNDFRCCDDRNDGNEYPYHEADHCSYDHDYRWLSMQNNGTGYPFPDAVMQSNDAEFTEGCDSFICTRDDSSDCASAFGDISMDSDFY